VYFICKDKKDINRKNKRTKVVKAVASNLVSDILKINHLANYIKSIRNLEDPKYYIYDRKINEIEQINNELWEEERRKEEG
jgi:hypothetical protein